MEEYFATNESQEFGVVETPAQLISRKPKLPIMPRCSSYSDFVARSRLRKNDIAYAYFKLDFEIEKECFPICDHTDLVAGGFAPVAECRFFCYFKNLVPIKKMKKKHRKKAKNVFNVFYKNMENNCKNAFMKASKFFSAAKFQQLMPKVFVDAERFENWEVIDEALDALAEHNRSTNRE